MKYFNEDLQPNLEVIKNGTVEELKDFNSELLEVNKLLTIEKYLKTKDGFYKNRFLNMIIQEEENKVINYYGVTMNQETFNKYLKLYNEIYKLQS